MTLPASVQEQLDAAQEHFDRLHRETEAAIHDEANRIVSEHNADFTQHSARFVLANPLPVVRWGRVFGEGVQALRSSLDHLVYAIAVREHGSDPPPEADKLMFPILDPPKTFPAWRIRSLSDGARAAINVEQPNPDELDGSSLWQLEQFNRSAKHRKIRLVMARGQGIGMTVRGLPPLSQHPLMGDFFALEHGTPFMTITHDRPMPDVQVDGEMSFFVGIDRIGGQGFPADVVPLDSVTLALTDGINGVVARVAATSGF